MSVGIKDVRSKAIETCFVDRDINAVAQDMIDHPIRSLAVLDRKNAITGFTSVDDLAKVSQELASKVLESTIPRH